MWCLFWHWIIMVQFSLYLDVCGTIIRSAITRSFTRAIYPTKIYFGVRINRCFSSPWIWCKMWNWAFYSWLFSLHLRHFAFLSARWGCYCVPIFLLLKERYSISVSTIDSINQVSILIKTVFRIRICCCMIVRQASASKFASVALLLLAHLLGQPQ